MTIHLIATLINLHNNMGTHTSMAIVFSDSWKIGLDWRQATTESIPICYPFDDHLITTTGCPESVDLIPFCLCLEIGVYVYRFLTGSQNRIL